MKLSSRKKFLAVPFFLSLVMVVLAVSCFFAALKTFYGFSDFSQWNPSVTESFVSFYPDDSDTDSSFIKEATALLDSAPMFVPGPWNAAGTLEVPVAQYNPMIQSTFPQYSPEIKLNSDLLGVSKKQLIGIFASGVEKLPIRREYAFGFQGLGQEYINESNALLPLNCHIEFTYLGNGRKWERTVMSPLGLDEEHLWSPLVFYGAVGSMGMDAAPFTANTTGLEKLDKDLGVLVRNLIMKMELPTGNYRIVVGP